MIKFDNKMQEFNYYIELAKKLENVDKEKYAECIKKAQELYNDAKKEAIEYEKKVKSSKY